MARRVEFDEALAIQGAMEVFWRKGYKGASLRDLTAAMKINPSSLYNTIGDKHELFVRCLRRFIDDRKLDLERRRASSKSPREILVTYIDDAVAEMTSVTCSWMALKATFEVAADDKRIQDILKEDQEAVYRFVYSLIADAIKKGEIGAEEDPQLVTDFLISAYIGWHQSFILDGDPAKIKKMARYLVKRLLI